MRLRRTTAMLALPATVALAAAMAASPAVAAQQDDGQYDTSQGEPGEYGIALDSLNDSGATGSALLTLAEDGSLMVSVEADGLAPGLVHAQHVHGDAELTHDFSCPPPEADEDGDGFVNVAEGLPFYGGIHIALTTEGDSSPESGLAVDRMPVADENGQLSYSRTFSPEELPDGTAAAIRNLHIAVHGIGWYDRSPTPGERGPSVFAGHINWNGEDGVFRRLGTLTTGDQVTVRRADGSTARFEVTKVAQYPKDEFPTARVYGNTREAELRLITCSGEFDPAARSFRDNTVVYAELVG